MPTGYTAPILEGATTRQFMLRCIRAMGVLVHMRDEPSDAEIPTELPIETYHKERLAEAEEKLARLKVMTLEQATALCEEDNESARKSWEKRMARVAHERLLYTRVLRDVEAWVPPTLDHQRYKDFMLEQLRESIKFDCDNIVSYTKEPEPMTPEEWLEAQLANAQRDVEYQTKEWAQDQERHAERNAYLKELLDALPEEPAES